jgi:predicted amidohydrolase
MRLACLQVEAQDWQGSEKAWAEIKKMMVEASQNHDLIIVPECVYPAYFLAPMEKPDFEESITKILDEIKEICKKTHTYIAFGYADKNENLASLFNPQGEEIARKAKSNLWHFDKRWFKPGSEVVTADTEFGKVGLVICADARLPELVRSVALENVKLVIDLANLTASGPEIAKLSNAQSDYMLATRARENKVWLAVADKWGVEADTITYAGRSAVYSPDGTCVAQAPADRNMIVSVEIPTDAEGEILCTSAEDLPLRRPELYTLLASETTTLPVYHSLTEAVIPERLTPYVTVSSFARQDQGEGSGLRHVKRLLEQEPDLIVLPARTGEEKITAYQSILKDNQFLVTTGLAGGETRTRLINNQEILAGYRTIDSVPQNDALNPENNFPVVKNLPFGRISFLHEKEMLLPEAAAA